MIEGPECKPFRCERAERHCKACGRGCEGAICIACGGEARIESCETCPNRDNENWLSGGTGRVIAWAQDVQRGLAMGMTVNLESLPAPVFETLAAMEAEKQAKDGGRKS